MESPSGRVMALGRTSNWGNSVSLHLKIWQMMGYQIEKGACDILLAPKQQ
jgi:hypothetical protein